MTKLVSALDTTGADESAGATHEQVDEQGIRHETRLYSMRQASKHHADGVSLPQTADRHRATWRLL